MPEHARKIVIANRRAAVRAVLRFLAHLRYVRFPLVPARFEAFAVFFLAIATEPAIFVHADFIPRLRFLAMLAGA